MAINKFSPPAYVRVYVWACSLAAWVVPVDTTSSITAPGLAWPLRLIDCSDCGVGLECRGCVGRRMRPWWLACCQTLYVRERPDDAHHWRAFPQSIVQAALGKIEALWRMALARHARLILDSSKYKRREDSLNPVDHRRPGASPPTSGESHSQSISSALLLKTHISVANDSLPWQPSVPVLRALLSSPTESHRLLDIPPSSGALPGVAWTRVSEQVLQALAGFCSWQSWLLGPERRGRATFAVHRQDRMRGR